jgi:hypothetical protein
VPKSIRNLPQTPQRNLTLEELRIGESEGKSFPASRGIYHLLTVPYAEVAESSMQHLRGIDGYLFEP